MNIGKTFLVQFICLFINDIIYIICILFTKLFQKWTSKNQWKNLPKGLLDHAVHFERKQTIFLRILITRL